MKQYLIFIQNCLLVTMLKNDKRVTLIYALAFILSIGNLSLFVFLRKKLYTEMQEAKFSF